MQEVWALHDKICQAGYCPDLIDLICMIQGWNPLPPPDHKGARTMRVGQADGKVYEIRRVI